MRAIFCRHLKAKSSFEEALRDTISRGGDTDTNAAIVCGLIGALHGASKIPEAFKAAVLANNEQTAGRPDFLVPSSVPQLTEKLLEAAALLA